MAAASTNWTKLSASPFFQARPKLYDLLAVSPVVAWYILSLVVQWPVFIREISAIDSTRLELLAMLDGTSRILRFVFAAIFTVLLLARRPPIKRPEGFMPRVIAVFGVYVGIAAQVFPIKATLSAWLIAPSMLVIAGLCFSIYALVYLGRSVSVIPESRKLVTSGPYSIVRHPLYLGEQMAIVGIAIQSQTLWVILVLTVQTACQLYRIRCEENILAETFPEYEAYRASTPFIIPGLR
jgi:protein-S-isoprenylcysteine O-methyltransferase Ste14